GSRNMTHSLLGFVRAHPPSRRPRAAVSAAGPVGRCPVRGRRRVLRPCSAAVQRRGMGPMARFDRLSDGDLTTLAIEAPDTPMHMCALLVLDGRSLLDDQGNLRLGAVRARIPER